MRQAFPPAGVIFSLSGLEIKMVQVPHSWKVFSHGCKCCPRDHQEGSDSGNQTESHGPQFWPPYIATFIPTFHGEEWGRDDVGVQRGDLEVIL